MLFYKIGQLIMAAAVMMSAPLYVSATEIAVTLPPLAGLVSMLDKQAQVLCLLPAGADPHHFQLTPRKIEALNRTQLLIRASLDDGGWALSPNHLRTLDIWPATDHGWLNPKTVRTALPRIADELIRLHPGQAKAITASLNKALQQTREIEQSWHTALSTAKVSGILMQHPAWKGLMQSMGVPILTVLESAHHGHEYGPHKLEHALTTLDQHPDAWLLADSNHSNRALDWLARHAAHPARQITLDTLGECGLPWPQLMYRNIARMKAALSQGRL